MAQRNLYSSASLFPSVHHFSNVSLERTQLMVSEILPFHKVVDSVFVSLMKKHLSTALYCHGSLKDRTYFCIQLILPQIVTRP